MLLPLWWLSGLSRAVLPLPTYPECGEPDRMDLCPSDLEGEWQMLSYVPVGARESVRPAELAIGSGNGQDRAFRVTTGRFDVILAVIDSGIDWEDSEYQSKIVIETGELPLPLYSDGTESVVYDLNADGMVNIQDYAEDPRVSIEAGRDEADGQLDASDLIYTFSDGVDDDADGYIDNIAGWDFFADDNDPFTEWDHESGTHGSGVISEMAAEGEDGHGDIGACPNCSVIPIRDGDSFVTDGARAALAMVYAVDHGAVVINMSLGALSGPGFTADAIAYARDRNVNLVGVAGDENSYHSNQPSLRDGILYVHSVRPSEDDEQNDVYSYLNFLNCNNFGPRVQLVAGSPACATGAAAITSGILGLMKSAAKDNGLELTADEADQILFQTSDDVYLTASELERAGTYPSTPGWDPYFGYGRVNAWRAVEMVTSGNIPPVANITSPKWLDYIDPSRQRVDIIGTLAADRSSAFDWSLEVGYGENPTEWTAIDAGHATEPIEGLLGRLDLSTVPVVSVLEGPKEEGVTDRVTRVMAPMVTVRAGVVDAEGRKAEFRKTFVVHEDESLVDGFPLQWASSMESSPVLADLDGDGIHEILIADSGGLIHAVDGTGNELEGWPVQTDIDPRWHADQPASAEIEPLHEGAISTVAVGDIDADGILEVVLGTGNGSIYAWEPDGSLKDGFPFSILGRTPEETTRATTWDNGIAAAVVLEDLDGDGKLEIIAAAMDQRLYVWDATGEDWGAFPIDVCSPDLCGVSGVRIIASPAVADVDGDGDFEIGIATNEAANGGNDSVSYLYDADTATLVDGWPLYESGLVNQAALLPLVGEGHPGSLAFADLNGDGSSEVASPVMLGQSPLYDASAVEFLSLSYVRTGWGEGTNTNEPSFATMSNNPAFGDMDQDGVPDYLIGGDGALYFIALAGRTMADYQHVLAGYSGATGEMLPGFPRQIEDVQFLSSPAIADLSGDGVPEAVFGSGGYLLHAWDKDGVEPDGWPKYTGHWILGSPAVGDIDGDGYLEVVVPSREGYLYAWHTDGRADQKIEWASLRHDPRNTGNYATPIEAQAGPPATHETCDRGCCCASEGGAHPLRLTGYSAALLVLAPLVALTRRRRRG
ncbi:MAG: hypothetical protein EXR69_12905 [Myxococcales bacterium]|nr:hypothetical protein [Myxococcales bacterium]